MDLSDPISVIIPSLEGQVLRVLAHTTTPLSGSRIADLVTTGSNPGIRTALGRLATPGGTVTVDGIGYTWPNVPSCQPDNILAAGQKILVHGTAGATTLGFLGSSGNGSAGGPVTVTYTDGTSQTSQLYFGDWAQSASNGDINALSMPYRNSQGGTNQQITMYVFADEVQLDSSKTVASVTMPMIADQISSNTSTHIFAIGLK
jgi:hypothetical protein